MRVLVKTIPYSKVLSGELLLEAPWTEVECDADRQEVRVYKILYEVK